MSADTQGDPREKVLALTIHFLALAVAVFVICFQLADLISPAPGVPVVGNRWLIEVSTRLIAVAVACALAWFSARGVHSPSGWFYAAHLTWIAALTWYGWFPRGGMFVVHEVVGAGTDLHRGWILQQGSRILWFLILITLFDGVPLVLHFVGRLRPTNSGQTSAGVSLAILRASSIICILLWFWFASAAHRNSELVGVLLVVALGTAAFCAARRQRGSLFLLLAEACSAPLVQFIVTGR